MCKPEKKERIEKIKGQNSQKIFSSKAALKGIEGLRRKQELMELDIATSPPGYANEENYYCY